MPPQNSRRRSSGTKWIPLTLLVLVVAGAALGSYALLNDGRLPWTKEAQAGAQASEDRAGKEPYARPMRGIPPFTAVTLEHLVDEKGQPSPLWLEPEKAKANGLLTTKEVLGRVTKAPKKAGYGFTEADFLPKGAPASRTAAIPAGMIGVSLTAEQVPSLRGFQANDRFVLVAAADPYTGMVAPKGVAVPEDVRREAHTQKVFGGETRRLVEGGLVIEAMAAAKASSKDPAFIAVPAAQYDELLAALNNGVEITALAESRDPTAKPEPLPEPAAPAPVETITIQNGDTKQTVVLPGGEAR
jgi:hypothetical protein